MRWLLSELMILLLPVLALGQATGQVLDIGFQRHYRPDCWTPMLIQLAPDTANAQSLLLQVKQEDMDRDHPIYSRLISALRCTLTKLRAFIRKSSNVGEADKSATLLISPAG